MDATEADIYLVSKLDRSQVIGRPVIYMAVDVASQLIAGVYVGLQWGEESVIECLRNAASDKVEYAARYDIIITGLPPYRTDLKGSIEKPSTSYRGNTSLC